MSVYILIPFLLGAVIAWLLNYLADVLPHTLRFSRPVCPREECGAVFTWLEYTSLRACSHCGRRDRTRPLITYFLILSVSIYLWVVPPVIIGFLPGLIAFAYLGLVALIDLEHHLILLPLNFAGLLIAGGTGLFLHGGSNTLFGGIGGFVIMYIFYLFGKVFTRLRARKLAKDPGDIDEALAFGDVILGGILGLFLGWPLIWFGLLLGALFAGLISFLAILGLFIRKNYKQHALMVFIPLGPAFITAALLLVYFPNWVASVLP